MGTYTSRKRMTYRLPGRNGRARLEALARFLDDAFRIPGIRVQVCTDAVLCAIPVVGWFADKFFRVTQPQYCLLCERLDRAPRLLSTKQSAVTEDHFIRSAA